MAATGFVMWARERAGLRLARSMFHVDVIENYIQAQQDHRAGRTLHVRRGHLNDLRRRITKAPHDEPPMKRSYTSRPTDPYSPAEFVTLRSWAASVGQNKLRHNAWAILSLGAGCGLTTPEISRLRTDDIHDYSAEGITVTVSRLQNRRTVWCRAEWEQELRAVSNEGPDPFVFWSDSTTPRAETPQGFLNWYSSRPHEIPLTMTRLRVSWLVALIDGGASIGTLLQAAGFSAVSSLTPYLRHTKRVTNDTYRSQLTQRRTT